MVNNRDTDETKDSFKVTDRRKFTSDGVVRSVDEISLDTESKPQGRGLDSNPLPKVEGTSQSEVNDSDQAVGTEAVDFSAFVMSLATTGMVHLGEIPEPTTGQRTEQLDAARQMIDILAILKEKTDGNLTEDENRLLETLLYELRMKFMEKSRSIKL